MSQERARRPAALVSRADAGGHFGEYGGRYVPETLMAALDELVEAYDRIGGSASFRANVRERCPTDSRAPTAR